MACVPKQGKAREWFTNLAQELGVNEVFLEPVVHQFWAELGKEKTPTPLDILRVLRGTNVVNSLDLITLWLKKYQTPRFFNSYNEAAAFKQEASLYFNEGAISIHTLANGKFKAYVVAPILLSENIDELISTKNTAYTEAIKEFADRLGFTLLTDELRYALVDFIHKMMYVPDMSESSFTHLQAATAAMLMPEADRLALNNILKDMGYTDVDAMDRTLIKDIESMITTNRSELTKDLSLIDRIVNFIKTLWHKALSDPSLYDDYLKKVSREILNTNSTYYRQFIQEGFEKKTLTLEELQASPLYEAYNVITSILKGALDGSAAVRLQGDLFRSKSEEFHDLDFTVPYSLFSLQLKGLVDKFFNDYKEQTSGKFGNHDLYVLLREQLLKDAQSILENTLLYKELKDRGYQNVSVVNVISTSELGLFTTIKIDDTPVDLFFVKPELVLPHNINGITVADFSNSFRAKMIMGRAKDIRDIINFRKFDRPNTDSKIYTENEFVSPLLGKIDLRLLMGATVNDLLSIIESSNYKDILVLINLTLGDSAFNNLRVLVTASNRLFPLEALGKRAYYDADTKTLYINREGRFTNGDSSSVIMHELMHHLTLEKLAASKEARATFLSILNEYVKAMPNIQNRYSGEHALEEFVADIWTNPRTIQELKTIQSTIKVKKTLWDRIKDFFRNDFFSKNKVDNSLFDRASTGILYLLEYDKTSNVSGLYAELETLTFELQQINMSLQLDNLLNSDTISASEVRHLAEQCVYWISDAITAYLEDPSKLLADFPDKVGANREETIDKIKLMSRIELVNFIGALNLVDACKNLLFVNNPVFEDFEREDIDELLDLALIISENFDAVMKFASDAFTAVENFSIVSTDRGLETTEATNYDAENYNESNESLDVKEEEGSELEHWLIESRTQDVLGSMSLIVRQAILQCYLMEDTGKVDENGEPIFDYVRSKFGVRERVNAKDVTNLILRWTLGSITYEDMISRLQDKAKNNPWLNQLIDRLTINQGLENSNTEFQSLFFGVFCKHFLPYSVVVKENGKYKSIPVNEHPALRDAVSSVTVLFKIGEHPMFTRLGVSKEQFAKFKEAVESLTKAITKLDGRKLSLSDIKKSTIDIDEIGLNIWFAAQCLGYYVSPEMVSLVIADRGNILKMEDKLSHMVEAINRELDNPSYDPFKFDKVNNPNGISGNLRGFLQPLTDILEDVAVSSFYDSGKMYQSYITPSYMTKLMNKFSLEGQEFEDFMEKEYGQTEWFRDTSATDILRGWKNEWLRLLATMSTEDRKKIFKHKVLLNFNKHNYMRNMSDTEYTLSIITEFFNETKADKNGMIPAWYRIPMLSNKPSSEFILFYRYTGALYKDSLIDGFKKIFDLELSRILTCEMRAELIQNKDAFIKSFDKNGKKFMFLDFMNPYLTGKQKTVIVNGQEVNVNSLLRLKLDGKEISSEEENLLNEAVKSIIKTTLDKRADAIIELWKLQGILEAALEISNIKKLEKSTKVTLKELLTENPNATKEDVNRINAENEQRANQIFEEQFREFIWNDAFAAMNIMQLTVTDIAYYKDAEDLQKRLALIHAPGVRGNVSATDFNGNRVTDGLERTFYLTDFDDFKSNIISNVKEVFDRKLQLIKGTPEYEATKAMYDSIIELFKEINVADAQGYSSPTSYRKKAFIFGLWSRLAEDVYLKLLKGEYNYSDLQVAFLPLKPFVYSLINKPSLADGAPILTLKVGVQNKNSEYLLIMADAILQGELTGRPNLLRAVYEVMEESALGDNTRGIDTVLFESTVKAGLMGKINIKQFSDMENGEALAKETMMRAIYNRDEGNSYNSVYVHEIPFEDYCMQQPVPEHFKEHELAHGSLIRYIIASDLETTNYNGEPVTYDFYDPAEIDENGNAVLKKLTAELFKKEYEENISDNILESIEELSKELGIGLYYSTPKARNIALSKILLREILSSPRYGVDLFQACSVDENGNFRIPLGDPILSKRVELLINSIIKNRVNKQKIAGGPVVQVTNFGTSKELNIRFKDKSGKILQSRKEFQGTDAEYKNYIKENQAGVAYFEVFAPIYTNELFERFADSDGNIDITAIEATNPDLLKMIGYRIPTEDKYSMAPLKIVGFLPREAGEGIMMPNDITLLTGSDFDKHQC